MNYVRTGGGWKNICKYCQIKTLQIGELQEKIKELNKTVEELQSRLEKEAEQKVEELYILERIEELANLLK